MFVPTVQQSLVPSTEHQTPVTPQLPVSQPELLISLAMSNNPAIRKRVASCSLTPSFALKMLAIDPHRLVRLAVARNHNVPYAALLKLAGDPDVEIRIAVAANKQTPLFLLTALSHDDDPFVSASASHQKALAIGKI